MPFQIRDLTHPDVDAAATVLERAFGRRDIWAEELRMYLHIEPLGAQVAIDGGRIVGVGGSMTYGPFAWIGVMGVEPERQGQGIARAILDRLLVVIRERNCPIAVLDASAAGESLYDRAGFRDHGSTTFFECAPPLAVEMPADDRLSRLEISDLPDVGAFDIPIFGAGRFRVLNWLVRTEGNRAYVARTHTGEVAGYVVVRPGRIGPWVADNPEVGELLLAAALADRPGNRTAVRVPSENKAGAAVLHHYGFVPRRTLRHMYLGPNPPCQDRGRIFSQASLALG